MAEPTATARYGLGLYDQLCSFIIVAIMPISTNVCYLINVRVELVAELLYAHRKEALHLRNFMVKTSR